MGEGRNLLSVARSGAGNSGQLGLETGNGAGLVEQGHKRQ